MGAGGVGASVAYQESVDFVFNDGTFLLDLIDNTSLGTGFDSAEFQIILNGSLFDDQSFASLAVAQAFFSNNLIDIPTGGGLNNIQVVFDETLSGGEGFNFDYGAANLSDTPLPATFPLFATGLGALGLLGWRRKRYAFQEDASECRPTNPGGGHGVVGVGASVPCVLATLPARRRRVAKTDKRRISRPAKAQRQNN